MEKKTRIVFTGDIAFSRYFQNSWENEGCLAATVKNYLNEADHVVANVESPLTDRSITSERTLNHASNPGAGRFLAGLNMKVWNLANNHIMDCGVEGLKDTLKAAKENDCQIIGAGNDLDEALKPVILGDTIRVGVLSVASATWRYLMAGDNTPGAVTWDKMNQLHSAINNLRKKVDWVVLVVHGGDEYCDIALPYIREKYHALLGLGVDIIVGHHPHVIQNYERVGRKMIFYSLGNFIFDTENQRDFAHTDNGVLLGIDFGKEKFAIDHLAIHIDREKQIVEQGDTPVVFCEINKAEYSRLWPLEAKIFYPVDLKKRRKQSVRLRSANWILFLGHEVLACRHKKERTIQIGRILSLAGNWKKTSLTDICGYLMEHTDLVKKVKE